MITLVIADDHALMREGVKLIFQSESDIKVVAEASHGIDALHVCRMFKPDVLLLDIHMPHMDGLEACERMRADCPDTRVLAFTQLTSEETLLRMLESGAWGYVLKQNASDELVRAVRAVAQGNTYITPAMTSHLVNHYRRREQAAVSKTLTAREKQIIKLIAEGMTNQQIAERLSLSVRTVQTHRSNAMTKIDVHNGIDLVKYAIREKLVTSARA